MELSVCVAEVFELRIELIQRDRIFRDQILIIGFTINTQPSSINVMHNAKLIANKFIRQMKNAIKYLA